MLFSFFLKKCLVILNLFMFWKNVCEFQKTISSFFRIFPNLMKFSKTMLAFFRKRIRISKIAHISKNIQNFIIITLFFENLKKDQKKIVSNVKLHYVLKHSCWPFLSRSYLFEWLSARGHDVEVGSLILQLSSCFAFLFVSYKHTSFW